MTKAQDEAKAAREAEAARLGTPVASGGVFSGDPPAPAVQRDAARMGPAAPGVGAPAAPNPNAPAGPASPGPVGPVGPAGPAVPTRGVDGRGHALDRDGNRLSGAPGDEARGNPLGAGTPSAHDEASAKAAEAARAARQAVATRESRGVGPAIGAGGTDFEREAAVWAAQSGRPVTEYPRKRAVAKEDGEGYPLPLAIPGDGETITECLKALARLTDVASVATVLAAVKSRARAVRVRPEVLRGPDGR